MVAMTAIASLPFHLISIFILGTPNNYWSRMVPITNTWGQHFDHMYFMMAKNKANTYNLMSTCIKRDTFESLVRYKCHPRTNTNIITNVKETQRNTISLLYSTTCGDKYFGASPTCKLEKAMLYFL